MDEYKYLANMLRMGTVMDADRKKRLVRVKYLDTERVSGWLPVLSATPEVLDSGTGKSGVTGETAGGQGDGAFEAHRHTVELTAWMPKVNDRVLCLFVPVFNGDGFVLGRIG